MPSTFPTTLDALSTTRTDSTVMATNHAADHDNANDAINKIEAYLGLTGVARVYDVETKYGAIPDSYYEDGVMTISSTTFTSATANFTAGDVGKQIVILGGGDSSAQDNHCLISGFTNSTTVTLSDINQRSRSSVRFYISRGGDQTTPIQNAINAASAAGGGIVDLPGVGYLVSGLVMKNRVWLRGRGTKATFVHLAGANTSAGGANPVIRNDDTLNNSAGLWAVTNMWIDGNRNWTVNTTSTIATTAYVAGASTLTLASATNFPKIGKVKIGTNWLMYTGKSGNQLTGVTGGRQGTTDAGAAIGATVTAYTVDGINIRRDPPFTGGTLEDEYDPHILVRDVFIKNVKGDGIVIWGQSEVRMDNVWALYCDNFSFQPGYDTWMSNCTSDHSGRMGFYTIHNNIMIVNSKAFYSGGNTAADGHGFYLETDTQPGVGAVVLSSCIAQDNKAHGFMIRNGDRNILAACAADSNGTAGPVGTYCALNMVSANGNIIDLISVERRADGTNSWQQNALLIDAASTNNQIRISHAGAGSGTVGTAIKSTSVLTGAANNILVNGVQYSPTNGGWITVSKPAITTRSNTAVLAADPILQFAMVTGTTYRVRGVIFYDTTAATDFQYSFSGPTGTIRFHRLDTSSATGPGAAAVERAIDVAMPGATSLLGTGTNGGFVEFDAVITATSSTTFSFNWAQAAAAVANTSVLPGSYIEYAIA